MLKDKLIKLSLILVLVGLALWVCLTAFHIGSFERKNWRLGLDLKGGTHIVYEADISEMDPAEAKLAVEVVKQIIENRINAYGVAEPIIQIQGTNRISVQLPGVSDIDEALQLIGATAQLDFRKLAETAEDGLTSLAADANEGETILSLTDVSNLTEDNSIRIGISDYIIKSIDTEANTVTLKTRTTSAGTVIGTTTQLYNTNATVTQWIPATGIIDGVPTQLVGVHLESDATVGFDTAQASAQAIIYFNLKGDGPKLFGEITEGMVGKPLGIFLDKELVSSPNVIQKIDGGSGTITGLELDEAKLLAIQLNQGALPLELETVIKRNVSSTLGADSLRRSLIAGGIGLALVLMFMMAYYRLPGVVSSLALIIYALVVLSIFKLLPVTLTLAGIAAFVLSIGMAVDANVLIFERMKEEIRSGRTVGAAIEAGFDRAWSSIRDSNISTILTCIVLIIFGRTLGANVVTGFAITLLIGVVISMLTAIVITKTLLRMFIGTRIAKKLALFCSGSKGRHTDV